MSITDLKHDLRQLRRTIGSIARHTPDAQDEVGYILTGCMADLLGPDTIQEHLLCHEGEDYPSYDILLGGLDDLQETYEQPN